MKQKKQKIVWGVMVLLTQIWLMSCAGGHVSENGIFQDGHKELKSSLVGSWRIINPNYELMGEELYTFYAENKKVKLKVKGKERKMERFDSSDGLSFSFEYLNDLGERIYVAGQFKSSAKEALVLLQEPMSSMPVSLNSLLLQRGTPEVKTVVASTVKN
ncbi:MAG: hypothetical protein HEP71_00420 [Roseivirga sp.]|nr:hypothetical protein [Roseivirga sp.]